MTESPLCLFIFTTSHAYKSGYCSNFVHSVSISIVKMFKKLLFFTASLTQIDDWARNRLSDSKSFSSLSLSLSCSFTRLLGHIMHNILLRCLLHFFFLSLPYLVTCNTPGKSFSVDCYRFTILSSRFAFIHSTGDSYFYWIECKFLRQTFTLIGQFLTNATFLQVNQSTHEVYQLAFICTARSSTLRAEFLFLSSLLWEWMIASLNQFDSPSLVHCFTVSTSILST